MCVRGRPCALTLVHVSADFGFNPLVRLRLGGELALETVVLSVGLALWLPV